MTRARRLLVPGLTTLVMLAVLIGLGTWQVQRLAWKTALLADISRAEAQPAVPLPAVPSEFAKVRVTGTLRGDLTALYGAEVRETRDGPELGAQLIVPLMRTGQDPLLVDRGWVPMARKQPIYQPTGAVAVEGYIRAPDQPGLFSATDDPEMREFYTLDPAAIGAALGLPHVAPFTLIALGPTPPEGYPDPAKRLPRPPNDHLSYAITWYGLAVTLVIVFAIYSRKILQP